MKLVNKCFIFLSINSSQQAVMLRQNVLTASVLTVRILLPLTSVSTNEKIVSIVSISC